MQSNGAMNKRKGDNKYIKNNRNNPKRRKRLILEPGMTGFLCTCNFQERGCITDAYKLLNLFADEASASHVKKEPEISSTTSTSDEKTDKSLENINEDEDIETALEKEINELKTEHEMPLSLRKFQAVDTGVKNMIFIASTLPNPLELVTKIVTKLNATKEQYTRYLLRLLPIEVVCKAYTDDIKAKANILLEKYFAQEPKTFSILFFRRSNNSIKKDEVIEDLGEIILKKNPGNKVDLKNPEIAVIVEVIRGICLLSVAPNYYKFRKYNLLEICNSTKNKVIPVKKIAEPVNEKNKEDLNTNLSTQKVQESTGENRDIKIEIKEEVLIRLDS